jgi:beta-glucanase (GH16 family)
VSNAPPVDKNGVVKRTIKFAKGNDPYEVVALCRSDVGEYYAAGGVYRSAPVPVGVPGTWNLIFQEEFDGPTLDTSRWDLSWWGWPRNQITRATVPNEACAYDPALLRIEDGILHMGFSNQPVVVAGKTYAYRCGLISTSDHWRFTYGVLEARMWIPPGDGPPANWQAFWTDVQDDPGEIDVLESIRAENAWHYHWSGGTVDKVVDRESGWRTLAVNWQPGSLTFYYDGVEVGRVTEHVTDREQYVIVQNTAAVGDVTFPVADTLVDYVRVWQRP